jgi:hypothetical protein
MRQAFEEILGMVWGISPTLSPAESGMGLAFTFGMIFGVEKQLLSPHSQNSIL